MSPSMRARRRRRGHGLAIVGTLSLVLAGLVTPNDRAAAQSAGTSAQTGPTRAKTGPLSSTLRRLADRATTGSIDVATTSATGGTRGTGLLAAKSSGPGTPLRRPNGRLVVDVRVTDTSEATLAKLRATGASISFVAPDVATVTMEASPTQLAALGQLAPTVTSVTEVPTPATNVTCPSAITSEGDAMLAASTGRTGYSVDGTGITVGVLSDSYDNRAGAAADVTAGELPGSTNTCGYIDPVSVQAEYGGSPAGDDEGRAMAQIVHDLAPGAKIRFATAFISEANFAQQVRDLATAGAKVIVDDITYFAEPMYQDGLIAKAVEDVSAAGVAYFSAAANSNYKLSGNDVGSYEATYRPTPCPAAIVGLGASAPLDCHDFNSGAGTDATYGGTINGDAVYVLGWNEPQYGIATDFDFYLLDQFGNLVYDSNSDPIVSDLDSVAFGKAYEALSFAGTNAGFQLVIGRYSGAATPKLKIVSFRSPVTALEYTTSTGGDVVGPTVYGHNGSRAGAAVAAIPYNNSSTIETYSSRGPATWCWGPVVGTTPAASLGACTTATIDMAATDGGQNSFFGSLQLGIWRFYGTSAAAPHAAAIAALIRQKAPCLTGAQVIALMQSTAHSIGGFTADAQGSGRIDANAALAGATCTPGASTSGLSTLPAPRRLMDTRAAQPTYDGQYQGIGLRTATSDTAMTVTNRAGIPANATAVVLNVTVTQPSATGWITVHPCGTSAPNASNVNFVASDTIANSVVAKVGTGGQVCFFTSADAHLIVDASGYMTDSSLYVPLSGPARVLDTRSGFTTADHQFEAIGQRSANVALSLTVTNRVAIPANADAVDLNLTVTSPAGGGWLTVYPCGTTAPNASAMNFASNQTIANHVIAKVGTGGAVCITSSANTHLVADVAGYFTTNLVSLASPARLADSRPTYTTIDSLHAGQGLLQPNIVRAIQVTGRSGISASSTAAVLTITVTGSSTGGWITVTPCGQPLPTASSLNFAAGQTIAATVVTPLGAAGQVCVSSPSGTQLVVDATGYLT